jgi:hypothetical protein
VPAFRGPRSNRRGYWVRRRIGIFERKPHWQSARRELWLGDALIKRFRRPAPNQEMVLAVFEEDSPDSMTANPRNVCTTRSII